MTMDTLTLWLLFLAIGLGTFLIRLSFIQLHGSMKSLLQRSHKILILLPPAILAALCIPAILFTRPTADYQFSGIQLIAGVIAVVVAHFTRSVFWPVIAGMAVLWFAQWLR